MTRSWFYVLTWLSIIRIGDRVFALPSIANAGPTYPGQCTVDSNCPSGTACVSIKVSATLTYKKCTPNPVCRGSTAGACPSYHPQFMNPMCVFVNTTKLRNIKCCTNSGSNSSSSSDGDCLQCFRDGSQSFAGNYECIQVNQCNEKSSFRDACSSTTDCFVEKGNLCNQRGTCYPSSPDDPKNSFRCLCQQGFYGGQCELENTTSSRCIVDCGRGGTQGTCTNNECKCKAGWDGPHCLTCKDDSICDKKTSDGTSATCDGSCGDNGQCVDGVCSCTLGCIGGVCTVCETQECLNCSVASIASLFSSTFLFFIYLLFTLFGPM